MFTPILNGSQVFISVVIESIFPHLLTETLRKYPPVSSLFRRAQNDYKVPDTDQVIAKGTSLMIPVYSIQRDAEYFPDPDKFNPDRFESDQVKQRDLMTWLPFGEGKLNHLPCNCSRTVCNIVLFLFLFVYRPAQLHWTAIWYDAGKNWLSYAVEQFLILDVFKDVDSNRC